MPFLQEAVKRFDLLNPVDGARFPLLPKEALPSQPDPAISEWHDAVSQKLMLDAQESARRNLPPRPQMALSDGDRGHSRDSSVDTHSMASAETYGHFSVPSISNHPPAHANGRDRPTVPRWYTNEAPWSSERRRGSLQEHRDGYTASWHQQGSFPVSFQPPKSGTRCRPKHARADSEISTMSTSSSDSSSITTSSLSLSPIDHHSHLPRPSTSGNLRHSTSLPLHRPASHHTAHRNQDYTPSRQKNVRWQDMDNVFDQPVYKRAYPARDGREKWDTGHGSVDDESHQSGRARTPRNVHCYERRIGAGSASRQ